MHPPPFRSNHHLSDWPECSLKLNCLCRGSSVVPLKLLLKQRGDVSFEKLLPRLRCQKCGKSPAPVYFCAGHREFNCGSPPDWAIELVPKPQPAHSVGITAAREG